MTDRSIEDSKIGRERDEKTLRGREGRGNDGIDKKERGEREANRE